MGQTYVLYSIYTPQHTEQCLFTSWPLEQVSEMEFYGGLDI